ncbi:hypothetical protein BTR23_13900 [Alkalihalophilus pseudofirmus]|nr:hypothetical protein BTR23_13900 [Alkalihalophilus pseudofirmus]
MKKIENLKLLNYHDFCKVKEFRDYRKGVLQENSIYIVKEPETLSIIPPLNSFPKQKIPNKCLSKEFYFASIKNALCFKHQTIVYDNQFILPDSFRHCDIISSHRSLQYDADTSSYNLKEKFNKVIWQPGDCIFLSGENSSGFGHFLLETVSRLWITKYIGIKEYKFIMNPYDRQPWQIDILRALGIRPEQIVYLHHPVRCERLHIPVQSFVLRMYTSTFAYETWQKIGEYYDASVGFDKIYVSRSKLINKRRRLLNELEVEKVFSSKGFSIIHPQELSINKQINLFRNAKIIAGPSGSAMYNCVFQNKPIKKLILSSDRFFKMSDVLINTSTKGQLYYFIGHTVNQNTEGVKTDWWIDIGKLKKFLIDF